MLASPSLWNRAVSSTPRRVHEPQTLPVRTAGSAATKRRHPTDIPSLQDTNSFQWPSTQDAQHRPPRLVPCPRTLHSTGDRVFLSLPATTDCSHCLTDAALERLPSQDNIARACPFASQKTACVHTHTHTPARHIGRKGTSVHRRIVVAHCVLRLTCDLPDPVATSSAAWPLEVSLTLRRSQRSTERTDTCALSHWRCSRACRPRPSPPRRQPPPAPIPILDPRFSADCWNPILS